MNPPPSKPVKTQPSPSDSTKVSSKTSSKTSTTARIWERRVSGLFTPNPIGTDHNGAKLSTQPRTFLTMGKSRERLPTLFEVLNRMSAPPVDLWTFYEFMRTNYRGVEYLDFWLDAANHVKLCKQYVEGHDFEESSFDDKPNHVTPAPQTGKTVMGERYSSSSSRLPSASRSSTIGGQSFRSVASPSSSVLLNMLGDTSQEPIESAFVPGHGSNRASHGTNSVDTSGSGRRRDTIARLSALLDEFQTKNGEFAPLPSQDSLDDDFDEFLQAKRPLHKPRNPNVPYESDEDEEAGVGMAHAPVLGASYERVPGGSPTRKMSPQMPSTGLEAPAELDNAEQQFGGPLHSYSEPVLPSQSPHIKYAGPEIVTLEDIYASVNSIVLRYLTPGSEREILLPGQMARHIREAARGAGRRDPALFNEARDYVFEVMEREAYPAFLASAALRNVRPASSLFRLIFGMIALFGAFWLSFVFILLDWQPKSTRLWIILPFGVGWYLTLSSLYNLDAILGLLGYGEREEGGIAPVKEEYILKLIRTRAVLVAGLTVAVSACFIVLFALVPGHRL